MSASKQYIACNGYSRTNSTTGYLSTADSAYLRVHHPGDTTITNANSSRQYTTQRTDAGRIFINPRGREDYHSNTELGDSWGAKTVLPGGDSGTKIFVTSHSGKKRLLTTTPTIDNTKRNSQKTFSAWADNESGGLADQIKHMGVGKKNIDGEDVAAEMFFKYLSKRYPKTFESFLEKNSIKTKIKRMDAVQTGAVATDVGLSGRQMEKLERHIRFHCGYPLFCPRDDLKVFTEDCPEFDVFTKKIKHKDDTTETIHILMHDIEQYLCREMDREIQCTYKSLKRTRSDPMFGYTLLSSKIREGIYTLLGTDHGQEFCQFLIRLLLGTPEDRRAAGRSDYETKTINFCTIKCKKDTPEILEITKENVDNALKVLTKKQMIGIEDWRGRVWTLFIDKDLEILCAEIDTTESDSCKIKCERNGREVEIKTKVEGLDLSRQLNPFKVIEGFHNFQCGDLAAQFTLQGRHGMSSCRCMHCNLTHYEWNRPDVCQTIQKTLTFDDIKHGNNSSVGNTAPPTYPYDPLDCLSPVLHGEIGTGNSQLDSSLIPLLIDVDSATEEEYKKLLEKHELECRLSELEEEIGAASKISENEGLTGLKAKRSEAKKKLWLCSKKIQRAEASSRKGTDDKIRGWQNELSEGKTYLNKLEGEISQLELNHRGKLGSLREEKRRLNEKKKEIAKKIDGLMAKRKRVGESLVSNLHTIMEKNRITVKAWHGGSLTGGHTKRLFRRCRDVLEKIESLCYERMEEREESKEFSVQRPIPKKEYVSAEFEKHRELFKIQDYVYSSLRIIKPTDEECNMTQVFMDDFEKKWREMGLSITCKMHFNIDHACNQQRRVEGFGDKCEDWIERAHQEQLRHNRITFGMMPTQALKLQAKLKWRANNPLIREQIMRVHAGVNRELRGIDDLSVKELNDAATNINKGWKEKYGAMTKLKRTYATMQGAPCADGS